MKFSEIQITDIAQYLHLNYEDLTDSEKAELSVILDSSREFVRSQTALKNEVLDIHADIVVLTYCLCQHQYDNRCYVLEIDKLNPMMQAVLYQYAENYIV